MYFEFIGALNIQGLHSDGSVYLRARTEGKSKDWRTGSIVGILLVRESNEENRFTMKVLVDGDWQVKYTVSRIEIRNFERKFFARKNCTSQYPLVLLLEDFNSLEVFSCK